MITESRNKNGTLTLDALAFASQATNVRLVPDTDEAGDVLETLSGDTSQADDETSWSLVIGAVQDFDDPAGFVAFAFNNANELVPFSWQPNADSPTYTGNVRVRPVEIGGDVNKRLTTEAEWPINGQPVATYPVP